MKIRAWDLKKLKRLQMKTNISSEYLSKEKNYLLQVL
jgi:hypothetical protein